MQTILIIEPNNQFARALAQTLKQTGPVMISTVATIREGCLIVAQRPQDAIFIPVVKDAEALLRALRALQPGVPIILTLPTVNTAVSPLLIQQVQGILPHSDAADKLPQLLQHILHPAPPVATEPEAAQASAPTQPPTKPVNLGELKQTLRAIELGRLIQTVIVIENNQVLARHGAHTDLEVGRIAQEAGQNWEEDHTSRLQFMSLRPRKANVILYSERLPSGHLLTLVATIEASLSELRLKAGELTAVLQDILAGSLTIHGTQASEDTPRTTRSKSRIAYNIAWQPHQPLPNAFRIPIRRAIQRLAHENACILTTISVEPDLVHLNINCPSTRGSDWVAFLLKNGSEEIMQKEANFAGQLWESGYYATESTKPLSTNELNLFLDATVIGEQ